MEYMKVDVNEYVKNGLEIIWIMFNSLFFVIYIALLVVKKSDIGYYITYKVDFVMIFSQRVIINLYLNYLFLTVVLSYYIMQRLQQVQFIQPKVWKITKVPKIKRMRHVQDIHFLVQKTKRATFLSEISTKVAFFYELWHQTKNEHQKL